MDYFDSVILPTLESAADEPLRDWLRRKKQSKRLDHPSKVFQIYLVRRVENEAPYIEKRKYQDANQDLKKTSFSENDLYLLAENLLVARNVYEWIRSGDYDFAEKLAYYQARLLLKAYQRRQETDKRLIDRWKKANVDKKHHPKPSKIRDVVPKSLGWPPEMKEKEAAMLSYLNRWASNWGVTKKEKQTGDKYTRLYVKFFGEGHPYSLGSGAPSLERPSDWKGASELALAMKADDEDKEKGIFWYFRQPQYPRPARWVSSMFDL